MYRFVGVAKFAPWRPVDRLVGVTKCMCVSEVHICLLPAVAGPVAQFQAKLHSMAVEGSV